MSTFTDEDLTILEDLEFETACQSREGIHPDERPPARWVVYRAPRPCGCSNAAALLTCTSCKDFYLTRARVACPHCSKGYLISGYVLRIEPLR